MKIDPNAWPLVDALHDVHDPETGLDVVDMGLVYEVAFRPEDGAARVVMTLTTPACPAGGVLLDGVERRLREVEGVRRVEVELTFEPRWSTERISEAGRRALGWS